MGPKKAARPTRARPTAHEAFIDDAADDGLDQLPLSDEEGQAQSKKDALKIIARDGQLGFSHQKRGFDPRTNFTLEIIGDIFSVKYQLKGKRFTSFFIRTKFIRTASLKLRTC